MRATTLAGRRERAAEMLAARPSLADPVSSPSLGRASVMPGASLSGDSPSRASTGAPPGRGPLHRCRPPTASGGPGSEQAGKASDAEAGLDSQPGHREYVIIGRRHQVADRAGVAESVAGEALRAAAFQ